MNECPNCKRLQKELDEVKIELNKLKLLVAKLVKNSSTSSKPPSSDIVKPPKKEKGKRGRPKKRKRGGQPGHQKHERAPFQESEIDEAWDYIFETCPSCNGKDIEITDTVPRVIQQVEIVENPITVTEHRAYSVWCHKCKREHMAPLPPEIVKAGLCGTRLTALVAFMKNGCHASFSTIRKFLRDVVGLNLSRGQLAKLIDKVSQAVRDPYEELLNTLRHEASLGVDETGHKENGKLFWTWCFRAAQYTVFKIEDSRGSKVLTDILGNEFSGILNCDLFSAYKKFMGNMDITVQFCLAHLIRDVKFLTTVADKVTQNYGFRLLASLKDLFSVIHRREQFTTEKGFQRALEKARDDILKNGKRGPNSTEVQKMVKRFKKYGKSYFTFITTPGIEPTNNLTEQAIRFVVIDRVITQGTRSPKGREWSERIWTVMATTTQQGRSAFEYISRATQAWLNGDKAPPLIPIKA